MDDKRFEQINKRLEKLEAAVFSDDKLNKNTASNPRNKQSKSGSAKSIQDLIDSGFFDNPKTLAEILGEFRKRALRGHKPTLSKELTRAIRKGLLDRDGKGGNKDPWKYRIR